MQGLLEIGLGKLDGIHANLGWKRFCRCRSSNNTSQFLTRQAVLRFWAKTSWSQRRTINLSWDSPLARRPHPASVITRSRNLSKGTTGNFRETFRCFISRIALLNKLRWERPRLGPELLARMTQERFGPAGYDWPPEPVDHCTHGSMQGRRGDQMPCPFSYQCRTPG